MKSLHLYAEVDDMALCLCKEFESAKCSTISAHRLMLNFPSCILSSQQLFASYFAMNGNGTYALQMHMLCIDCVQIGRNEVCVFVRFCWTHRLTPTLTTRSYPFADDICICRYVPPTCPMRSRTNLGRCCAQVRIISEGYSISTINRQLLQVVFGRNECAHSQNKWA